MKTLLQPFVTIAAKCGRFVQQKFIALTKPATKSPSLGAVLDLTKSKPNLVAENALLRQQLLVLNRQIKHTQFKPRDRFLLVILARLVSNWKQVLLILKPDTLLGWHRQGFRLLWKIKSKPKSRKARIDAETIALIKQMTIENPLWGAERIRGELLKLEIKVAKRTIQKYMRQAKPARPPSQTWRTFLKNHGYEIWSCDYLPITDIFFRQLYAFVIVELSTRKIIHIGVTRHPTDEWTAQQLREATPFDQRPKYLIRDNDAKFSTHFERVATGASIIVLKTPFQAPNANAICERLMRSIRQECLNHFLILNEGHLSKVIKEYIEYYNLQRPHQGIGQLTPVKSGTKVETGGKIVALPILGGLHHYYEKRIA
jgi:putative transposase